MPGRIGRSAVCRQGSMSPGGAKPRQAKTQAFLPAAGPEARDQIDGGEGDNPGKRPAEARHAGEERDRGRGQKARADRPREAVRRGPNPLTGSVPDIGNAMGSPRCRRTKRSAASHRPPARSAGDFLHVSRLPPDGGRARPYAAGRGGAVPDRWISGAPACPLPAAASLPYGSDGLFRTVPGAFVVVIPALP